MSDMDVLEEKVLTIKTEVNSHHARIRSLEQFRNQIPDAEILRAIEHAHREIPDLDKVKAAVEDHEIRKKRKLLFVDSALKHVATGAVILALLGLVAWLKEVT